LRKTAPEKHKTLSKTKAMDKCAAAIQQVNKEAPELAVEEFLTFQFSKIKS
jgi:hypothetical protein